ncbi:hypothetical protein [Puniceibacterium antarcticum]|uniref:hypothetical protein n=1 Tax=Puniceibacterium antarcticum TaxID=1206336 RepID=UPI000C19DE35|nr:hypothetical protein [Puniceibacterium antarcticum]
MGPGNGHECETENYGGANGYPEGHDHPERLSGYESDRNQGQGHNRAEAAEGETGSFGEALGVT